MNNEISMWNGYPVHGNAKELDRIIENSGYINNDQEDIISVLSAEGDNHLTSGINVNLDDAFNDAAKSLPCTIAKVNSLLIDLSCGNKQPTISEISSTIKALLSEASPESEMVWGISSDKTLGDSFKLVLLVSVKA